MRYFILGALWLLAACGEKPVEDTGQPVEQLQELAWLVGHWRDQSEDVDVSLSWNWEGRKHFLSERYEVLGEEGKTFVGKQILGWDPIRKTLRSWIFDSDGGFGESTWIKEGESWYAETTYTLASGKRASTTHIYRKVDPNTYVFSSEGRAIEGEVLPNIGPFTIVKETQ